MCGATDMLRRLLGIHEYDASTVRSARVRRPTHYGMRGNGIALPDDPVKRSTDVVIERLVREHRLIRWMLDDTRRMRGQG
jgi:hypothetical protein